MTLFALGCLLGWLITGTVDYVVTRKAVAGAYRRGMEEGRQAALRQVSGW